MKQTTIDWGCLSRHRGQLMGVSILFIVLFHIGLPRTDAFFGLKRMGNVGVDLFFFLSGIGLWYAWCKRPETWHFYQRRLLRILPAWLVVAWAGTPAICRLCTFIISHFCVSCVSACPPSTRCS